MPTLDDLQAAFDQLADGAPAALAEPVRPTHRRRTAVLLAAACTAAVAVGVPLALHHDAPRTNQPLSSPSPSFRIPQPDNVGTSFTEPLPAPADGESPDLAYGFAFPDPAAGYTVIPDAITRTYQHASVYGPTDPPGGEVFVFYRGEFDPSDLTDRASANVDGHTAYTGDYRFPNGEAPVPVLAWEYADDGWATVFLGVRDAQGKPIGSAQDGVTEVERQARIAANAALIAASMKPAHTAISVPVQIPSALATQVDAISVDGSSDGTIQVSDARTGRQWILKWSAVPIDATGDTRTIHGHVWDLNGPSSLLLVGDDFGLTISTPSPVGSDVLEQFAGLITIADDPATRSSWFPADTALP